MAVVEKVDDIERFLSIDIDAGVDGDTLLGSN